MAAYFSCSWCLLAFLLFILGSSRGTLLLSFSRHLQESEKVLYAFHQAHDIHEESRKYKTADNLSVPMREGGLELYHVVEEKAKLTDLLVR